MVDNSKFNNLVDLALKMAEKGRSPRNIYLVLESKGANKEELKAILDIVYHSRPKATESTENLETILLKRRLSFDIQMATTMLKRLAGMTLFVGLIMYAIASEEINQNTVYSYISLLSGIPLLVCWLVLTKGYSPRINFYVVLAAFILFTGIHLIEFLTLGKPNFYLKDYKYATNYIRFSSRTGVAGLVALIIPYLYIMYNCFVVASLSFPVYTYYKQFLNTQNKERRV